MICSLKKNQTLWQHYGKCLECGPKQEYLLGGRCDPAEVDGEVQMDGQTRLVGELESEDLVICLDVGFEGEEGSPGSLPNSWVK